MRSLVSVESTLSNGHVLAVSPLGLSIDGDNSLGMTALEIENPGMFLDYRMGQEIRISRMLSARASIRETVFFFSAWSSAMVCVKRRAAGGRLVSEKFSKEF